MNSKIINGSSLTFLLFLLFVIFLTIWGQEKEKRFRSKIARKPSFGIGVVQRAEFAFKSGDKVEYSFEVNNTTIKSERIYPDLGTLTNIVIKKSFPVVYYKDNPEYNDILILPEDFAVYNIAFPDSLQWIMRYRK